MKKAERSKMFFTRIYLFSSPTTEEDMNNCIHFFYPHGSSEAQQLRTIGFAIFTESISDGKVFPTHFRDTDRDDATLDEECPNQESEMERKGRKENQGGEDEDDDKDDDDDEFHVSTIETKDGGVLCLVALPPGENAKKVRLGLEIQPYPRTTSTTEEPMDLDESQRCKPDNGRATSNEGKAACHSSGVKDDARSGTSTPHLRHSEVYNENVNPDMHLRKQWEYTWTPAHVHCWLRRLMHLCNVVAGSKWYFPQKTDSHLSDSTVRFPCSPDTARVLSYYGRFLDFVVGEGHKPTRESVGPQESVAAYVSRTWGSVSRVNAYFGFPTFFGSDNNNYNSNDMVHENNETRIQRTQQEGFLFQPSIELNRAVEVAQSHFSSLSSTFSESGIVVPFIVFRRLDFAVLRSSLLPDDEIPFSERRAFCQAPPLERYIFVSAVRLLLMMTLFNKQPYASDTQPREAERGEDDRMSRPMEKNLDVDEPIPHPKNPSDPSVPSFSSLYPNLDGSMGLPFPFPLQWRQLQYRATVYAVKDSTPLTRIQGEEAFLVFLYPISPLLGGEYEEKGARDPDHVDVAYCLHSVKRRYGALPTPTDAVPYRQQWMAHVEEEGAGMIFGRLLRSFSTFCEALYGLPDHTVPVLRALLQSTSSFPLIDEDDGVGDVPEPPSPRQACSNGDNVCSDLRNTEWVVTGELCSAAFRCDVPRSSSSLLSTKNGVKSEEAVSEVQRSDVVVLDSCETYFRREVRSTLSKVTVMIFEALQGKSFFESMDDIESFAEKLRESLLSS